MNKNRKLENSKIDGLTSDWLFKKPIDFEYKKYILLNYIKNSENRLNELKIYPDLQEITINIANIASIVKDNKIISLNKILIDFDTEINLSDFKYDLIPDIESNEQTEINKTINFTYPKLLDLFNFAKSIWVFAFDNIDLRLKKNKQSSLIIGYFYYYCKSSNLLCLYFFDFTKNQDSYSTYNEFEEVFYDVIDKSISIAIILNLIKKHSGENNYVIYEVKATKEFPIREALIPIVKRKLMLKNKPIFTNKKYIN